VSETTAVTHAPGCTCPDGGEVWVTGAYDDSPVPLAGLVVSWEPADWCWVVWGAEAAQPFRGRCTLPPPEARREPMDELTARWTRATPARTADEWRTWTSPDGIDHIVPGIRPCATCGRHHDPDDSTGART
jgi:hypothetical protein